MAKFNTATARPSAKSPVVSEQSPSGTTHEGAPGYARDAKGELFLLAVTNMGSEETFYESAKARDSRYAGLIRQVATDDLRWLAGFLPWLRDEANMRTAPLIGAAEAVKALIAAGKPGGRQLVASVLRRADEPGELLAYWHGNYGRNEPKPLKRGAADAIVRLYTEYCVAPETLVLRDDLRWIPAGELAEGDNLVGFDEQIGVGQGRGSAGLRRSAIEHLGRKDLPSVKIVTDRGEITVSEGHQFVARHGDRNRNWKLAVDVRAGDQLLWMGEPWPDLGDGNRDAGYAAGLIDGEGWLGGRSGSKRVYFGQLPGFVWDEAVACFGRLGFEVRSDTADAGMKRLWIAGGRYESMRFLGQIRPVRLIERSDETWLGGNLVSKGPFVVRGACLATVQSVENLGSAPVITMQTSTRTFIANGFFSHNSLLKYDTGSHGYRFADVIERVHPAAAEPWRGVLFEYAIDRRHNRDNPVPEALAMIRANIALRKAAAESPSVLLDADALKAAGMTWEDALSLAGSAVSKADLWSALIPSMGYMALIRNLRNFDEAKVPDDAAAAVSARLTDPEQVARSRQFPFRFLAAYRAAASLRWAYPLEKALNLSLANVPALAGRTLILVDRSGSMFDRVSARSDLTRADSAAIFGSALAVRCEHADLVQFGTSSAPVQFRGAESVLKVVERFGNMGGTNTADAVRRHYRDGFHSRVIIVTDEQTWGGCYGAEPTAQVPAAVPVYTWNLAGYQHGHGPSGPNRHTFGGLSDTSFRMVPLLEARRDAKWPWEQDTQG